MFTTLLKSKGSTEAVCTYWILAPWRLWLCESSPQWCPQAGSRHPRNPGYCLGDWLVTCQRQNNLITLTCHLNLSRHIMLFSKNLLTAIDPSWHSISISQAQLSSWPSPGISFISLNRVGKALCAHGCFLSFGLTAPKVWYQREAWARTHLTLLREERGSLYFTRRGGCHSAPSQWRTPRMSALRGAIILYHVMTLMVFLEGLCTKLGEVMGESRQMK